MLTLRIALRYLFSRKSHNVVNVISRISVAGVAVATAAIVCVLSVFNGFTQLTASRLSKIDPDLRIEPATGKTIAGADSLAAALAARTELFAAAAPVVEERALAMYGSRQLPVRIKGVPDGYDSIVEIDDVIIDGEFLDHDGDYDCATMSVGVAISLNARPGYFDKLTIFTPRRTGRINAAMPMSALRTDTLLLSAVYEVEQSEYDTDRIILPIRSARRLLDYTTEAQAIELRLAPGVTITEAKRALADLPADRFVVKDRLMQQDNSFKMIAVEKWITFAMLAFILVIASFNVISTMSMLIIEKEDNISTLQALGAAPSMISWIFLLEGWLISLIGGAAGIILGTLLCIAQQAGGFIKLNGDPSQLSVTAYPVSLQITDLVAVALLVAATGLLIGLIASRYSARMATSSRARA